MKNFDVGKETIFRIFNTRVSRTYVRGTPESTTEGDKSIRNMYKSLPVGYVPAEPRDTTLIKPKCTIIIKFLVFKVLILQP